MDRFCPLSDHNFLSVERNLGLVAQDVKQADQVLDAAIEVERENEDMCCGLAFLLRKLINFENYLTTFLCL